MEYAAAVERCLGKSEVLRPICGAACRGLWRVAGLAPHAPLHLQATRKLGTALEAFTLKSLAAPSGARAPPRRRAAARSPYQAPHPN
jgi:hypothetical protein